MNTSFGTIDQPGWLLLFPVAAWFFIHIARRSQASLPARSRRLALILRLFVVALLLVSLARPHIARHTDRQAVLFLLDVSQSIRPDQRAAQIAYIKRALAEIKPGDQAGVITFGQTPALDIPLASAPSLGDLHADVGGAATDLTAALRLAEGTFPGDRARKIVLLTDGNETRGDAAAEADALRLAQVRVDVAPVALDLANDHTPAPEALVASVHAPESVSINASFVVRVALESTVPQSADLAFSRDGHVLTHQTVSLVPGRDVCTFTDHLALPGVHRYAATLTPTHDGLSQNNQAYAEVLVRGHPRLLYVSDAPAAALPRILTAQGIDVTQLAPGNVSSDVNVLTAYQSVILSDVPANEFSPAQMQALKIGVGTFGMGLGMLGGPNSFGAGSWEGTPIEAALPVQMVVPQEHHQSSAAVVVVLDASGSMAKTEDDVEKVQLGARAAVQLMHSLQPSDEVAVTSVTDTSTVVVPLQPAKNASHAQGLIEDVHAGGAGIYCLQGLEDAYALLSASHAPIKHVILVADLTDSEQQEHCAALAAYERSHSRISTSVVGIGQPADSDAAFQRGVARAGGGQWTPVAQASDLPQTFRRDVETLKRSWFVETPTYLVVSTPDSILAGMSFAAAPSLLGHNLVTPKSGGTTILRASSGDPLLVTGQSGLGRTFAFLSDDRPHWAADFLRWPLAPRFYAQTVRWTLKPPDMGTLEATADTESGRAHLTVDTVPGAPGLAATVCAPDLSAQDLTLRPAAPGRYAADFDADLPGTYLVSVHTAGNRPASHTLRVAIPYAPEYRTLGPNLPLLTRLADETGGRVQPLPVQVFRDRASFLVGDRDASFVLLLLAAFLFLADIAVRRLALTLPALRLALSRVPASARKTTNRVRAAAFPSPAPVAPAQMETLLTRRIAARAPTEEAPPASGAFAPRTPPEDDPFPRVASLHRPPPSRRSSDD